MHSKSVMLGAAAQHDHTVTNSVLFFQKHEEEHKILLS